MIRGAGERARKRYYFKHKKHSNLPPLRIHALGIFGQASWEHSVSSQQIRILLVESHAILRAGLRALIETEPDLCVVADVADWKTALETCSAIPPDIVVTDLGVDARAGIAFIAELRRRHLGTRVVVLTSQNSQEKIQAALDAGADGYVLKDAERDDLMKAARAVASGHQYLCSTVLAASGCDRIGIPSSVSHAVTKREREVLTRIALGQSNKVIAQDLAVSIKTVEKHRANLMRKLTLHNAAAVTLFALRNGFIDASLPRPGRASIEELRDA